METKLARIISILFQPLLIPTYSLLILFSMNNYFSMMVPYPAKKLLMWMIFLCTFVFPVLFIFILYKRGMIKTLNMDLKEERIFPLTITGIFYALAYYIVYQIQLDMLYQRMFLGSTIMIVIALIISFYWKISMHLMGVGGMMGVLTGISLVAYVDLSVYIILSAVLCGLVGFARLKLQAHTPLQVYVGFLAGFFLMLVSVMV